MYKAYVEDTLFSLNFYLKIILKYLVILYCRLSGLSPFAGADEQETLDNVKKCDWTFDPETFKGISDIGKDFIKKLLVKVPQYVELFVLCAYENFKILLKFIM